MMAAWAANSTPNASIAPDYEGSYDEDRYEKAHASLFPPTIMHDVESDDHVNMGSDAEISMHSI